MGPPGGRKPPAGHKPEEAKEADRGCAVSVATLKPAATERLAWAMRTTTAKLDAVEEAQRVIDAYTSDSV